MRRASRSARCISGAISCSAAARASRTSGPTASTSATASTFAADRSDASRLWATPSRSPQRPEPAIQEAHFRYADSSRASVGPATAQRAAVTGGIQGESHFVRWQVP